MAAMPNGERVASTLQKGEGMKTKTNVKAGGKCSLSDFFVLMRPRTRWCRLLDSSKSREKSNTMKTNTNFEDRHYLCRWLLSVSVRQDDCI